MALPVWPVSLPTRPQREGFSIEAPFTPPLRTEMVAGNIRQRKQVTMALTVMTVTFDMSATQYQTFRAFVRDDLGFGSGKFTMSVWNGSTYVTRTVQINEGTYKSRMFGLYHSVAFTLNIESL